MDRSGTTGHLLRRRGDYFRRLARFLHHAAECKSGGAMAASRVDRHVGDERRLRGHPARPIEARTKRRF